MKYQISYQDYENGSPGVVSAYLETQNVAGAPGMSWEPNNVPIKKARRILLKAVKEGYRPTGDTTRDILSTAIAWHTGKHSD